MSGLNPEAPEFFPQLKLDTALGYNHISESVKSSRNMPTGVSLDLLNTVTDFNLVKTSIGEKIEAQSNQILSTELTVQKVKMYDTEYNTERIQDANDFIMDRVHINIDNLSKVNEPSQKFIDSVKTPIISEIQVGSTTFFGAKNIPRPQLLFKDTIDNSTNIWVPKISDKPNSITPLSLKLLYNSQGEAIGYEHPYSRELELYSVPSHFIERDPSPPVMPSPVEASTYTFVDTASKLDSLIEHLYSIQELAVDVEHHSYRTYQGITCLVQITTDEGGDFILDALTIREHMYKLNVIFTDPNKLKVFHGAANDVLWLQRDFGLYIVGLFDTYQAAQKLDFPALSLKHLLWKYCQFEADKKYRLADWRIRPLPDVLVEYARSDTHYLLYVWRRMKEDLLEKNAGMPHLLLAVFEASRQVCGSTYQKEVIDDLSHIPIYMKSAKAFNSQQLMALYLLYKWRDEQARELDESVGYLIPNHMLLKISETMPREVQGITACCSPVPPFVHQNLYAIHNIILRCRETPNLSELYTMPKGIQYVLNSVVPSLLFNKIHDLNQLQDASENDSIAIDQSTILMYDLMNFYPDIQVFLPENNVEATPKIVSTLNAEAKLFIPPYDRYRKYKELAQVEVTKEKEKEEEKLIIEKNDLMNGNNSLIKYEVTDTQQKSPDKPMMSQSNVTPDEEENITTDDKNNITPDEAKNITPDEEQNVTLDEEQNVTLDEEQNVTLDEEQNVTLDEEQNATPDEGKNVTPYEGKNVTPDEGKNVTPDEGKNVTPDEGKNVTPDEGKNVTPDEGKNVTPNEEKNITPDEEKNVTPGEGKNVTPDEEMNVTIDEEKRDRELALKLRKRKLSLNRDPNKPCKKLVYRPYPYKQVLDCIVKLSEITNEKAKSQLKKHKKK